MSTDLEPSGNGNGKGLEVADLAELRQLVTRLDRLLAVPSPGPASINPDGTPGNVAPGDLIESAWGNAVVYQLGWATTRVETRGGTAHTITSVQATTMTINVPGAPYARTLSVHFAQTFVADASASARVQVVINGTNIVLDHYNVNTFSGGAVALSAAGSVAMGQPVGAAVGVEVRVVATGTVNTYVDTGQNFLVGVSQW